MSVENVNLPKPLTITMSKQRKSSFDTDDTDIELQSLVTTGSSRSVDEEASTTAITGRFRDSLFDCFKYGPCHVSLCLSCCCSAVAASQVAERLSGNALWGMPFREWVCLSASFWILRVFLFVCVILADPNTETDEYVVPGTLYRFLVILDDLLFYIWVIFMAAVGTSIRGRVRKAAEIPGTCAEDCCCSTLCGCLVMSQLLRHTAQYDADSAKCCTHTGL